ncbi:MAG: ABC transporter ATP-binding protein [Deltaproteobacteria bacterium]|nr:ABC transporter ATP-binding protein [Deltaproteobacteria bacterium]
MDVQKEVILRLNKLTKNFGGLTAVNNVSLDIHRGVIHGLIGPNGSGKTTLINTVTGIYKASGGSIIFKDKEIKGLRSRLISELGISRTFQISRIFSRMTVLENLLVVAPKGGIKENVEKAMQLLKQVGLEENYKKIASSLPYGQRKLLEFARAVMTEPELIFLDEPTAGVTLKLIEKTIEFIHSLNNNGMTFVIVEHNMKVIMSVCERIFVLEYGKKIAEGTPKEVQTNPEVIRAYLGEERDI